MSHSLTAKFIALAAVILVGLAMIFVTIPSTPLPVQNLAESLATTAETQAEPVSAAIN
ncbi:hypothetical protein [Christensenella tenuis]|jgi:hypothetical protein|uniref:Uncharacterized protein n=1 Tax=Christensenella tenuis TaxID=2763033 RepID=A0ABR7EC97_9FIRM|nr:hypothetical protein [Christensenella tenuis]MBC5647392.1 hypothetical protein [Christensenella tenuis]